MSDVVIRSEGLGKSYTITHQHRERYTALRDVLTNRVKNAWSRIRNPQYYDHDTAEEFWALKNASFEIKQGDRVGIIGRNGAGKSTLLKILSRITEPTTGRVEITGRVASLLEVGTGFHPELTGRENIFLNGAILGMSQAEIKKKFDEIVAFAEVEQFLDTPVKKYSSGMYVRLAFAVAAHLESEILLVDEVLAVGDAEFQKKCLGKMQDVSTQSDRTILFVSHNMTAIQSLCSTGILLTKGGIQKMGEIGCVTNEYFSSYFHSQLLNEWSLDTAPGNEAIRVKKVHILPESDDPAINVTTPLKVIMEFWICQDSVTVNRLSLALKNIKGDYIFASISECSCTKGCYTAVVEVPGNFLNDDTYTIDFYYLKDAIVLFLHHDCLVFQVNDIPRPSTAYLGKWVGAVRPTLHWDCDRLADG
jgi:lipopolysaccharide transport system ATP-binding protein